MDFYATGLWYSLSYARIGGGFVILLASVAWEALFRHLELGSRVLNVDCVVGMKSSIFEDKEKTLDELKVLCHCSLLEWSHCWGFIDCSSLSLSFCPPLT